MTIEGKVKWLTNQELICRRAMIEAEKGSSVLHRLVNQLVLGAEPQAEEEIPQVIIVPDIEGDEFGIRSGIIREGPPT